MRETLIASIHKERESVETEISREPLASFCHFNDKLFLYCRGMSNISINKDATLAISDTVLGRYFSAIGIITLRALRVYKWRDRPGC